MLGIFVCGVLFLGQLGLRLGGNTSTTSAPTRDPIKSAAQRIGTDCRMTMRAPAGRTSQDAIDAFAALRSKDEPGFRALMASGRVSLLAEGSSARVLDTAYHGNIAIKVRVLDGPELGHEMWVFEGICQ
jgi:hypothetical protein